MKKIISISMAICMLFTGLIFVASCSETQNPDVFTASAGTYANTPTFGQVHIYCGSKSDFTDAYDEQYYAGGDKTFESVDRRLWGKTYRSASVDGWFSYKVPVDKNLKAPLIISLMGFGHYNIYADGTKVFSTEGINQAGSQKAMGQEFELTDSAIWADGYVEIKVENISNIDGCGIYFIELGQSGAWRDRLKRIIWDVTDVLWQVGYYDGTKNEFNGNESTINIGESFYNLSGKNKMTINFDLEKKEGVKYILLTGFSTVNGVNSVDVGNDGIFEYEVNRSDRIQGWKTKDMEVINDTDITAQLNNGNNVIVINSGLHKDNFIDFVALVEVTEGSTDPQTLRVEFKGNEMAENWTKILNTTLYLHQEILFERTSGFISCSPYNGLYTGLYWTPDTAAGIEELARWGYFDAAKMGLTYTPLIQQQNNDDAGAAIMASVAAYIMQTDNFKGPFSEYIMTDYAAVLNNAIEMMISSPNGLILGKNGEISGEGYAASNNSANLYALLNGADKADKMKVKDWSIDWSSAADMIKESMLNHLVAKEDNKFVNKGSWNYTINENGAANRKINAGWLSVYAGETSHIGFKANYSELSELYGPDYNTLLDLSRFWKNWRLYGNPRGEGTLYGCLSERGGSILTSMLLSDRMDMVKKAVEHLIYNSTDYNFEDGNEAEQELSPWALIRETDPYDRGGALGGNYTYIGNTPYDEDLNLVEYAMTMRSGRVMVGIDDNCYKDNNLVIMPRIPEGWEGVKANSYPISYRKGNSYSNTLLTFDYTIKPTYSSMQVYTQDSIKGVQLRFGPFAEDTELDYITVDGRKINKNKAEIEDINGYRYVWVKVDTNAKGKLVEVFMDGEKYSCINDFNNGEIDGFEALQSAKVENKKLNAPNGITLNTEAKYSNSEITADIFINGIGEAGVGFGGYKFVMNTAGKIQLLRDNTVIDEDEMNVCKNRSYTLKLKVENGKVTAYLNSVIVYEVEDSTYSNEKFVLYSNVNSSFDNTYVKQY